jgi:tetratricopeptide (TPR) repeat protein
MVRRLVRVFVAFAVAACGAAALAPLTQAQARPQQPPPRASTPQSATPQEPQQPPPVIGISGTGGGGGTGGAGGAGSGSGGGSGGGGGLASLYDGYGDIDWDGPDEIIRSPLVFQAFDVPSALDAFRAVSSDLAGSVARQPMTYDDAIAHAQALFSAPDAAQTLQQLRTAAGAVGGSAMVAEYGIAAGMTGKLETMLATELAMMAAHPENPTHAFNVSSLLAQRGMANEALAILDRLGASNSTPQLAFGMSRGAVADLGRGYVSLILGELQQAQSLLNRAFNADPSIAEASLALAVVQDAMGANPRKAFLEGFLQAYGGGPFMYCGEHYELDPLETEEEENVGPPTDEIFDLSRGVDGVLPRVPHPINGPQLLAMVEGLGAVRQGLQSEFTAHDAKATAIHTTLMARMASSQPKSTDMADQALADMIDESSACLKPLQKMLKQRADASEAADEMLERVTETLAPRLQALARLGDSRQALPVARQIVATAIPSRFVPISHWEKAIRIHHKSWHKYATGLTAQISDPQWRDYALEKIRGANTVAAMELHVGVVVKYMAYLPLGRELYAPEPVPGDPPLAETDMTLCTPQAQKGSVEVQVLDIPFGAAPVHPKIGVSMEASCDKMAIEMDAQVGVGLPGLTFLGAGGFLEASGRAGEITVFGGAKATGTVPGAGGSVKGGVFMTMDRKGLTSLGIRTDGSQRVGGGVGFKLQTYGSDFIIIAAPKRPSRLDPAHALAMWPTVK